MIKVEHLSIKVLYIITLIIAVIIFILNWYRLHYGVETSDEAYYVAEAYIVSNGAIPFRSCVHRHWCLRTTTL